MGTGLSRRDLLRLGGGLATATALGSTLAACGSGTGAGSSSSELTMTWWGGDDRHTAYKKALAAFEKKHTGIKIKPTYSGYDGYFDKFNTQVSGGSAPDLVQMDTAFVAQYATKGVLAPLDEYIGKSLDLTGFSDALLQAGTVDGKLYGVPSGLGVAVLTYNETKLKQLGLDLPDPEWTWDELKTYAQKVRKATGDKLYGMSDGGGDDVGTFEMFVRQHGGNLYSEDGKLGYDQALLEEWWTYWDDMRKLKIVPPGSVTADAGYEITKNVIITGKSVMSFGSGLENVGSRLTDNQLGFAPVPQGGSGTREGQYLSGGVLLSATEKSDRVDDSVEVMSFFAQDPTAIKSMTLMRGIPPTEKGRELVAPLLTKSQQRSLDIVDYVSKRVAEAKDAAPAPAAAPGGATQVKELLFQGNLSVAFGKKSVKAAVKEFFEQAESALA